MNLECWSIGNDDKNLLDDESEIHSHVVKNEAFV
jgi:hypothetical protein